MKTSFAGACPPAWISSSGNPWLTGPTASFSEGLPSAGTLGYRQCGNGNMPHSTGVLVVSDDPGLSDEVGGWLEDAGLDVLLCPGPRSAACIGLSGRGCDLERAADLVVLDLHPSGNLFVDSSLRTKLGDHYSSCGTPFLVLTA